MIFSFCHLTERSIDMSAEALSNRLVSRDRERIDAFHARFANGNASKSTGASPEDAKEDMPTCGGCGVGIEPGEALWCGACRCSAYCDKEVGSNAK